MKNLVSEINPNKLKFSYSERYKKELKHKNRPSSAHHERSNDR
jgi:hypothetical protein